MENEILIPVKDYEELYLISNYGHVISLRGNCRILKPRTVHNGYQIVTLTKNSKATHYKIHRLVALHFVFNKNKLEQVNHIYGDKLNNNDKNLEWVSNRENRNHFLLNSQKSSKYPGVCWQKSRNKWRARIRINDQRFELGYFTIEENAHEAYLNALKKYNIEDKYANGKKQ